MWAFLEYDLEKATILPDVSTDFYILSIIYSKLHFLEHSNVCSSVLVQRTISRGKYSSSKRPLQVIIVIRAQKPGK